MDLKRIIDYIESDQVIKFYQSKEWRALRLIVIERDNHECQHCKEQGKLTTANTINKYGRKTKMDVNHKKPLRTHPHLALTLDNLEYLCIYCHNIADKKEELMNQDRKPKFHSPERW